MKKVKYHVRALEPSIREGTLEELCSRTPNVHFTPKHATLISIRKGCFQRAFVKHTQTRQSNEY